MSNHYGYAKIRLTSALLLLLTGICTMQAATITVTNTNVSGAGSLRQAILDAADGDQINFDLTGCPCLIPVPAEFTISRNLAIQGPGAAQLILSGNSAARVFRITAGVTVTLDGLQIIGATGNGGTTPSGGAVLNAGGILTISNSTIANNETSNSGGAVFNTGNGTLVIINSVVKDNFALLNGGGIANNGTLKVINTTITDNAAGAVGGGISNFGTMSVVNSTIAFNAGDWIAGDNFSGGGINAGGNETLANAIVAGNFTGSVGGSTSDDILGTVDTASHSLIGDAATAGGIAHGSGGNLVGNGGSGTIDPAALLAPHPFEANGSTTFIFALAAGSPAIDAGDNALALDAGGNPLTTDQRGTGFPRIVNSRVDIGAFEQTPLFDFSGFFPPIENPPNLNVAAAGSSIPIRFSLGGDRGLNIFATGYPKSVEVACSTGEPGSSIEETTAAGQSSLTYSAESDQYKYIWKTSSLWKNTCRQLQVRFVDGSRHEARFRFR